MSKFSHYFQAMPIIGVLRGVNEAQLKPVLKASYDAGIRVMEITINTPGSLKLISQAATAYGDTMAIGAGTVLGRRDAEAAVHAGAKFIVAPNCDDDVAAYCQSNNVPYIPGALTPTEIYHAWEKSGEIVKVFPASVFGSNFIASLTRGPYDAVKMLVTGGVDISNLREYLAAGACGVAVGSGTVYRPEWIAAQNWDAITNMLKQYADVFGN